MGFQGFGGDGSGVCGDVVWVRGWVWGFGVGLLRVAVRLDLGVWVWFVFFCVGLGGWALGFGLGMGVLGDLRFVFVLPLQFLKGFL